MNFRKISKSHIIRLKTQIFFVKKNCEVCSLGVYSKRAYYSKNTFLYGTSPLLPLQLPQRLTSRNFSSSQSKQAAENSAHESPASNARSLSASLKLCIDNVKRYDFDGYLHGLLLPKEQQLGYFALKSFNVETALVSRINYL